MNYMRHNDVWGELGSRTDTKLIVGFFSLIFPTISDLLPVKSLLLQPIQVLHHLYVLVSPQIGYGKAVYRMLKTRLRHPGQGTCM